HPASSQACWIPSAAAASFCRLRFNIADRNRCISNSNILLTRFLSPDGVVEVCDFMPISLESGRDRVEPVHQLIRRANCVRGEVQFQMACDPRLDYGRAKQQV